MNKNPGSEQLGERNDEKTACRLVRSHRERKTKTKSKGEKKKETSHVSAECVAVHGEDTERKQKERVERRTREEKRRPEGDRWIPRARKNPV